MLLSGPGPFDRFYGENKLTESLLAQDGSEIVRLVRNSPWPMTAEDLHDVLGAAFEGTDRW